MQICNSSSAGMQIYIGSQEIIEMTRIVLLLCYLRCFL